VVTMVIETMEYLVRQLDDQSGVYVITIFTLTLSFVFAREYIYIYIYVITIFT